MSSLPEDIYRDILLRLPVKRVLVYKSVCRSWRSIVSDLDFAKMYIDLNIKRDNYSLIIKTFSGYKMYSSDSLSSSNESAFVELATPYKYLQNRYTALLGSCNGLVYGQNSQMKIFYLWNPASKEYKRLPKSDAEYFSVGNHGLGYDYKTNDYKLVNIRKNEENTLTEVYSLKSDSWKSFESIGWVFRSLEESGVLCNGALHWLEPINVSVESMIISMDISEERFGKLQFPEALPTYQQYKNMGVLEGCLCVLATKPVAFEVWVMQDYGVPDSWTKFYTISYEKLLRPFGGPVQLIGSLKNGKVLFIEMSGKVVSYDLKCAASRIIQTDSPRGGVAVKYFESLFSMKSITEAGKREKRILKRSMTKKRNRSEYNKNEG